MSSGFQNKKQSRKECPDCGKTVTQLKVHKESVHEGKKPYKCSFCKGRFSQNSHLKTHIQGVHEKKKSKKCLFCDAGFQSNGHLFCLLYMAVVSCQSDSYVSEMCKVLLFLYYCCIGRINTTKKRRKFGNCLVSMELIP